MRNGTMAKLVIQLEHWDILSYVSLSYEVYHSYELETLAIVNALRRFRTYLEGIPFRVITDCNSLVMTMEKKEVCSRIARWLFEMQSYTYEI